jgi:6-phosphogluconolactonase (cycloisomerase 2 family)
MRREAAWAARLFAAALVFYGCPGAQAPKPCSSSSPCPSGQICSQGACAACTASTAPPPSITCPASQTVECTGNQSAQISPGQASASDVCGATTLEGPTAGSYPLGTTVDTFTAIDVLGNRATCTQSIKVQDTQLPSISCPPDLTVECANGNGAALVKPGTATASDTCSPVTIVNASQGNFNLGTTVATYSATDTSGNRATCTQRINVQDTQPPSISCPADLTVECVNGAARVNPGTATASDTCSPVTIVNASQGNFSLGTTVATYSARDTSGNQATCTQRIKVQDTQPPQATAGPQGGGPAKALWPESNALLEIDVLADCQLTAADACTGPLTLSASNIKVGCVDVNEAALRSGGPDVVFIDATHLLVYAEAASASGGRIYRIPVQVQDASGNAATAVCRVDVGPGPAFPADSGAVAQTLCPPQPMCVTAGCGTPFFYAASADSASSQIHAFTIDGASGALTELPSSPLAAHALRLAAHPSGKYLYATDATADAVTAYAIGSDGSLTAIGTPLATGSTFPESATVDPEGTHLYVGDIFGGGGVSIYAIDPASGGLTAQARLDSGLYNHGIVLDPSGRWLYLSRNNFDTVARYQVDAATGALSAPSTLAAAGGYHSAMDPLGRFLFVTDWIQNGGDLVSVYAISGQDGTLTKVEDHVTGGIASAGVVVTPDGKFLYVVNRSSSSLAMFSVGAGGNLTALTGSPLAIPGSIWELALDPSGSFLYLPAGADVLTFAIDHSTGALKQLGKALPFAGINQSVIGGVSVLVR